MNWSVPKAQAGIGMVEVLIAVFILAIGILGASAMQILSLRSNHSANMRSEATVIAYDIIDKMRANRGVAAAGGYDIAIGSSAPTGGTVVALDLQDWKQTLTALPAGDGAVARNVIGGVTIYSITVQWDDSRGQKAPLQMVMDTEL